MTAQIHERLNFEGEWTSMACCPDLPHDHPRIVERTRQEAQAEHSHSSLVSSTACYRRYVGTWEVKEGRFYLVSVDGQYRLIGDEPLFADWVSGILYFPRGEQTHYVHSGFSSQYEQEIHLYLDHGIVTKTSVINTQSEPPRLAELLAFRAAGVIVESDWVAWADQHVVERSRNPPPALLKLAGAVLDINSHWLTPNVTDLIRPAVESLGYKQFDPAQLIYHYAENELSQLFIGRRELWAVVGTLAKIEREGDVESGFQDMVLSIQMLDDLRETGTSLVGNLRQIEGATWEVCEKKYHELHERLGNPAPLTIERKKATPAQELERMLARSRCMAEPVLSVDGYLSAFGWGYFKAILAKERPELCEKIQVSQASDQIVELTAANIGFWAIDLDVKLRKKGLTGLEEFEARVREPIRRPPPELAAVILGQHILSKDVVRILIGDQCSELDVNQIRHVRRIGWYLAELVAPDLTKTANMDAFVGLSPVEDFKFMVDGYTITITGYIGHGGAVIIPGTINGLPVTTIDGNSFRDCTSITSVMIPDGVTSIGGKAFRGCTNLMSVTIPESVTSIGYMAFRDCSSLYRITIPGGVTRIESGMFRDCYNLVSVKMGNQVASIGDEAFRGCERLEAPVVRR